MSVNASPEALRSLYDEIKTIDDELALASDTATAGKRKTRNTIQAETSDVWSTNVENFVSWLTTQPERVIVGALAGLDEKAKSLKDQADKLVEKIVEENEKVSNGADKPSQERVTQLSAQRRELNEKYKVLRSFLEMFDAGSVSDIPVPAVMRGLPGKRGTNKFKSYDFFLSDASDSQPEDNAFTPRSENTNSISSIASTVANVTAAEFRNYLKGKGINIEEPADSFVVQLANGRWMKAVKRADGSENPAEAETEEVEEDENVTAEV